MTTERADISRPWFLGLLALLLAVAAAVGLHTALAPRPLETHEVFVAQTVREMLARGDYLVPTFGGELRLKKPPLMYWSVAALAGITGRSDIPEFVARAPSAIASLLLIATCVFIGARVFDRRTGLLAGAILAFSAGVFEYAGNARPEMLYAACSAAGIAAFIAALRSPNRSLAWAMGGWALFGLALLAKGPQLPLLMLLGFAGYVLAARGVRECLRAVRPARGLLVMLLVAAPWVFAVASRVDGAADIWKNELIGLRFGGSDDTPESTSGLVAWLLEVLKPKYLLYLMSTLLPWGALVPLGALLVWDRRRPEHRAARDVFFALAGAVLGLSLASHSRDYYLLPALPLMAVLIARAAIDLLDRAAARRSKLPIVLLILVALGGLGFGVGVRAYDGVGVRDIILLTAAYLAAAIVVLAIARHMPLGRAPTALAAALAAWAVAFGVVGHEPVLFSERRMRVDEIARQAAAASAPALPVIAIDFDPNDLIYRLARPARPIDASATASDIAALAPCVLVAPPDALDRLAAQGLTLRRADPVTIRKGTVFVVATVERPPPRP